MQEKSEQFFNKLDGEVISLVRHVRLSCRLMGATSKIDFHLIVKKSINFNLFIFNNDRQKQDICY